MGEEREVLERWSRRPKSPHSIAQRARIVVLLTGPVEDGCGREGPCESFAFSTTPSRLPCRGGQIATETPVVLRRPAAKLVVTRPDARAHRGHPIEAPHPWQPAEAPRDAVECIDDVGLVHRLAQHTPRLPRSATTRRRTRTLSAHPDAGGGSGSLAATPGI